MEDIGTQKTISNEWMLNVFNILKALEHYERLARQGVTDLEEYIQQLNMKVQEDSVIMIRHKNYQMFMMEFDILLRNTKNIMEKEKYDEILTVYNKMQEKEQEQGGLIKTIHNQISGRKKKTLKNNFLEFEKGISLLRGLAVDSLWKVLTPTSQDGGLP